MKNQFISVKKVRGFIAALLMMALVFTSACMLAGTRAYAAAEIITQAESISIGKDINGTFNVYQDSLLDDHSHFYKFKTAPYGGVEYTLKAAATGATGGKPRFDISIYDTNFKQVDIDGNVLLKHIHLLGLGDADSGTYSNLNPNSTYYVEVKSLGNNQYANSYYIRINKKILKPAATVIKSVKPGKKKLTVKYAKVTYATEYQVQMKKAGGSWKTYNNGKKLSKVFSKLKKGKKYSVRVRAIRTVEGKTYKGAWSEKKTVKVK